MLQPLKKSSLNGEFLTDDDQARVMTTVGTSGVLVQPVNRVMPVRAGEAIPRMSMVYFSANDTVRLASSDPGLIPDRPPVGMLIQALAPGEVGTLVTGGEVTYDQWSWPNAGDAVYSDSFGQLSLTRPPGVMAFRVGFVKNAQTVLVHVDSETNPTVYSANTNDLLVVGQTPVTTTDIVNGLGERVVTIIVPDVTTVQRGLMTAAQHIALDSYGVRIGDAEADILGLQASKADVVHQHAISDVALLQTALNGKSDTSHNHDLVYAPIAHNHDLVYSQLGHLHGIGDVSGLQTALNQKANRSHLNAFSEIYTTVDRSGLFDVGTAPTLVDALAGKANTSHTHAISDVALLQAALNGKADVSHNHDLVYAPIAHNHDLVYAPIAHSHALFGLDDVDIPATPTDGRFLQYSTANSAWVEADLPPGGGFLFQVGAVAASHYHYALLTQAQAQSLIQSTDPTVPVADPTQPSVVISSAENQGHQHDVTVFFDYTNHTFIATDVTANHPVPHVAFVVGDGSGERPHRCRDWSVPSKQR
jgi:hypothetical protein